MDATLHAEKREGRGKNEARRLRAAGRIPAVVYGTAKNTATEIATSTASRPAMRVVTARAISRGS